MNKELEIIDAKNITTEDRDALNYEIDRIIAQHKDNQVVINRLAFESVEAMTEADNAQSKLSGKGSVK